MTGVEARSVIVTEPTELVFDVPYIRDRVLRTVDDGYGDAHIEFLIKTATRAAEHDTGRALMPQTWRLYLDRFPCGPIVLPKLPLVSITAFTYVDTDGITQTISGSPAEYQILPSSLWRRAELHPLYGEVWPTARYQPDAVQVTYTVGYDSAADVPADISAGIALMVGELYKLRSLSVHAVRNTASVLGLDRFWKQVP